MPKNLESFQRKFVVVCYNQFFPQTIIAIVMLMSFKFLIYALCTAKNYNLRTLTQIYNLRTLFDINLQIKHFVGHKVTIYEHFLTQSYNLLALCDTELQFTHFV